MYEYYMNYDIDISPDGEHWFHLFGSHCERHYPKIKLIFDKGQWFIELLITNLN